MKLNAKHIAGFVRHNDWCQRINNNLKMVVWGKNTQHISNKTAYILQEIEKEKLKNLQPKSYIFRQTALDVIDRIKIDGSFDPIIIQKTPIPFGEIILNHNELYRFYYNYESKTFVGWYLSLTDYYLFVLDVATGEIHYMNENDAQLTKEISSRAEHFFKCLVFLFFSEIKTVVLPPKTKIGDIMRGEFKNELKNTFIMVDTTWNKISIRTQGFAVRGHFRLQPCGPNLKDRKLIFIDEFKKHGYIRGAKKQLEINQTTID